MSSLRITFVVTHAATARLLLRGQIRFLRSRGHHVTVIASPGRDLDVVRDREGADTLGVSMARALRLGEGPRALGEMVQAIRTARPDVVHASTAKGGLLGALAARALRVKRIVYLVRGTLIETRRGIAKAALYAAERAATAAAHQVVLVSESLRSYYGKLRLIDPKRALVLPSNGIDLARFRPKAELASEADAIRDRLGIPRGARVIGFVGRLVADKGVADMIAALEGVPESTKAFFLVVGGDIAGDSLPADLERRLRSIPRVVFAGPVEEPAPYYATMNVLLFPSYREGLPNVPLEAAACEVPAVGYDVTGVRDAVVHERTGLLTRFGEVGGLSEALRRYLGDADLLKRHSSAARERVVASFEQGGVWSRWLDVLDGGGGTARTVNSSSSRAR
jgi:glycosyltransferase involved in cell wall biosynthesis